MMAGLDRQMLHLDLVANNMANVDTPGYRSTEAGLRGSSFEDWMRRVDSTVSATERSLDVALEPGVFLQVRTPQGDRYTRRGDLRLDDKRRLMTGGGEYLLSDGGTEIAVPEGLITIDQDGNVRSDGRRVARLARFRIDQVVETGGTLYTTPPDATVQPAEMSQLQVGVLERSNVDAAREQTKLIDALARARAYQQFAAVQDQTLGRLIVDVGRSQTA